MLDTSSVPTTFNTCKNWISERPYDWVFTECGSAYRALCSRPPHAGSRSPLEHRGQCFVSGSPAWAHKTKRCGPGDRKLTVGLCLAPRSRCRLAGPTSATSYPSQRGRNSTLTPGKIYHLQAVSSALSKPCSKSLINVSYDGSDVPFNSLLLSLPPITVTKLLC